MQFEISFLPFLCNVQCSPFIMLYLGSIGRERVICESCYKGTILEQNIGIFFPIFPM